MHWFVALQELLPQHLISRLVGKVAESRLPLISAPLISIVRSAYSVDMSDAAESEFSSLNAFFVRKLVDGARPIGSGLISPVDGVVSECGDIDDNRILQAKEQDYSVQSLLADPAAAAPFEGGSFITLYLAPHNYHRVHAPWNAGLRASRYVPGRLFSVNPTTVDHVPGLFARNERLVCMLDTEDGPAALIMVGAMLVAGIRSAWRESTYRANTLAVDRLDSPVSFEKGDEVGWFEFGSTVILLHSRRQRWLVGAGSPVTMGEQIAEDAPVEVEPNAESSR